MATFNFFRKPEYNPDTCASLWTSSITDSHDSFCGCTKPIAHLLQLIFPEGHKDLDLTIRQIIKRELEDQKCLFGGPDARSGGEVAAGPSTNVDSTIKREDPEEDFTKENIEELIAAAEKASER